MLLQVLSYLVRTKYEETALQYTVLVRKYEYGGVARYE